MAPPLLQKPLRPPGAAPEDEFLELCVLCAGCAAACPHDVIQMADEGSERGEGTPLIHPREAPCKLCMVCPSVCPTGALSSVAKLSVAMGHAVVDTEYCLAFAGQSCRACVDACPFPGKAIALGADGSGAPQRSVVPLVDTTRCVGCGLCVAACPTELPAIVVQ